VPNSIRDAYMVMVMVREGVCCLSSDEFVKDNVSAFISYMSVE